MLEAHLEAFETKMRQAGLPREIIDTFGDYYRQLVNGETGLIPDAEIQPVAEGAIPSLDALGDYVQTGVEALPRSVMIVLNGGLGTTMGLTRAKSLMRVKDGLTFLEVIVGQTARRRVRLALMNSFSTDRDTREALDRIAPAQAPLMFMQHKYPKVLRAGLAPAHWAPAPELEWNPPGHGDVFMALWVSGTLDRLLNEGIRYALIRNVDNLGASLDEGLLGYLAAENLPFMMEVALKTPSDVKGGHIARHRSGHLILREAAQCPPSEMEAFTDITRYRFFNTNNVWIHLEALKELIRQNGRVRLPIILNPKTLDPRNAQSPPVYQIETAMGAAIGLFEGAGAVRVPRTRFIPVKSTNELLAVRSDCYVFTDGQLLRPNPQRSAPEIDIRLDPAFFGHRERFNARIPVGNEPSLKDCRSLSVTGDVRFEAGVRLVGAVRIVNNGPTQAVIPAGSVIEGDLVF
ncbi:MAG: UTP--glucose-1-phosphate uridylyltransferase [Desulfobacterales bacterium]|jgi:UTP--glucose-1-phosphate uridylyltransferase|nr:UTP--glucose-1-phosphate uridylyltransferase [Desulfobacteraceae bacterium]MDY0311489.1 UTP--glucose-1-phosphate uridylyltransferase [Desulfobacterales bacterium]